MDGDKNKGGGRQTDGGEVFNQRESNQVGRARQSPPPILFVFLSLFYFHFHPLFRVLSISPSLSLLGLGEGGELKNKREGRERSYY